MSDRIAPIQFRNIDPFTQKQFNFYSDDPRIRLTRATNRLLKYIGNDIVIRGLDILKTELTPTNKLEILLCRGILIQDMTLIEIYDDFKISLDITDLDFINGYILIHTEYLYLKTVDNNPFKFRMQYVSYDGDIIEPDGWDTEIHRIYIAALYFDQDDLKFKTLKLPKLVIKDKTYYYRGFNNYTLRDIYFEWAKYLDFLDYWEKHDYVRWAHSINEIDVQVPKNAHYFLPTYKFNPNFQYLFNKVYLFEYDSSHPYFGWWIEKNNLVIRNKYRGEMRKNHGFRLYNLNTTKHIRANIVFGSYWDSQIIKEENLTTKTYNINDLFGPDIDFYDISIFVFRLEIDPYSDKYNTYIDISDSIYIEKTTTTITITTSLLSEAYIIINKRNRFSELLSGDSVEYIIDDVFPYVPFKSIWVDVYYEENGKYIKNTGQFQIAKSETKINISGTQSNLNIIMDYSDVIYTKRASCDQDTPRSALIPRYGFDND